MTTARNRNQRHWKIVSVILGIFSLTSVSPWAQVSPIEIIDECRDANGDYYSGGTWMDSFWYGSFLVDPTTAGTDYNLFRRTLEDIHASVTGHVASAAAWAVTCGFSAGTSYLWCIPWCSVSLTKFPCLGECWDGYMQDLIDCADLEASRIFQAWVEGDSLINWNLYLYGGC